MTEKYRVIDGFDYKNEPCKLIEYIETEERYSTENDLEANSLCKLLNEQEEQIQELEEEKESWKYSACHDMSLKSMLSFEIGRLTETKDVDSFLDFYYKHFCKINGDLE